MATQDLFEQLLSVKWRNIEIPITRHRMSIAHDLAMHSPHGVDGAYVESTGLAPTRFSFSAPLINGIEPGRNETWAALYPNQLRALIAAFAQKRKGLLQHPEFGDIVCKAERLDIDWDATRRGGVDTELTFIQTKDGVSDENILASKTPVQGVDIGAIELDDPVVKADLKALLKAKGVPLPPYLEEESTISLGEFANKIKAITDYPTLLSYRSAGQVNSLLYHVNRIQESAVAARSALTWPIVQNAERIKSAAHDLNQELLKTFGAVKTFVVPAATTLAGVARQLPEAKVGDLIKLNPTLMHSPEIPAQTRVRYYAA